MSDSIIENALASLSDAERAQFKTLLDILGPKIKDIALDGCQMFMRDQKPQRSATIQALVSAFNTQCQRVPNPALAEWMGQAIMMTSFAEVRDDLGIPDLALVPTGLVPTGFASNGTTATTFVAGFAVAPGQSILLKTQSYNLPFNPESLWGMMSFSAGSDETNYRHVSAKVWVGPKDVTGVFGLGNSGPLREWSPRRYIQGAQFRCGDSCSYVGLRSSTGCSAIDIVGINSQIYIQIDNATSNANTITGQQAVLKLGGFETPCCDSCAHGQACSTGCAKH